VICKMRLAGIFLVPVLLLACVGQRGNVIPDQAAWENHREMLALADDWSLRGRISFKKAGDGYSGSLQWEQRGDDLDFRFRGPLGIGGFRISGNPTLLKIKNGKGDEYYVSDPVVDLENQFGWSVPVHSMRFWVLGIPDPNSEYQVNVDEHGQATNLDQSGWRVKYLGYRDFNGRQMPRKLQMSKEDLQIRLAVASWRMK